jgi:hypothetical protein
MLWEVIGCDFGPGWDNVKQGDCIDAKEGTDDGFL